VKGERQAQGQDRGKEGRCFHREIS
jgi:hypothetical protein